MPPKRLSRDVIYESGRMSLYAGKIQYPDGTVLQRHHLLHFEHESTGVIVKNAANALCPVNFRSIKRGAAQCAFHKRTGS